MYAQQVMIVYRNEAPTTHVETPTSESVGVCASHPLNDSIVAGTPVSCNMPQQKRYFFFHALSKL